MNIGLHLREVFFMVSNTIEASIKVPSSSTTDSKYIFRKDIDIDTLVDKCWILRAKMSQSRIIFGFYMGL